MTARTAARPGLRPLVGLLALLLAGVPALAGSPGPGGAPVAAIERDLRAMRVQIEAVGDRLARAAAAREPAALAYETEVGDGGEAYRLRSLATMARSLARRVDRLADDHRRSGRLEGRELVMLLSLEVQNLHWTVQELRLAGDREAESALLARLDELLARMDGTAARIRALGLGS